MPFRTSTRRRVTGPWLGSPLARPLRRGSLPAALAAAATVIVLLMLPASAPSAETSAADPCTAGFACTTSCTIAADGNGGSCVVRECAAPDVCQDTAVAVPAADLDAPRACRLDRVTCEVVTEAPARCEVSADGFGAVCTLASREWRRCLTQADQDVVCQTRTLGGDPFVVAGTHVVPPATNPGQPPADPTSPVDPGTTPPSAPAPSQPAPQPDPTPATPTPAPTAPGAPAPDKPAPVAAPAQPATTPQRSTRRRPRVAVIRFRSGFGLPPGLRRAQACHGAVRLRLKLRGKMLAIKTVRLDRRCRYAAAFRIRRVRLKGARVVTIAVRFRGNDVLGATGRTYRVAVPS